MDVSLYRSSSAAQPRLRIGLLLTTTALPRWAAEVIDHIQQSDFANIDLVIHHGSDIAGPRVRPSLLYRLYRRWDMRNVDPATDPLAITDLATRLAHIDTLQVQVDAAKSDPIPAEAVEKIASKRLDVLITFEPEGLRGRLLSAATYGLWAYHHGDRERYGGGPAYFWELLEGNPVSGAVLEVLADSGEQRKILYRGLFATQEGFSQARNCVQPYWGASTFMIQKLRELHARGWDHVERNMVTLAPYQGQRETYSTPSNSEMARWLAPLLLRKATRRVFRPRIIRHWMVAVRVGAPPLANGSCNPDMSGFRWIESPRGRCYADPFLVEDNGKHWLYFENYDYATQLGKISCAELVNGRLGEPLTVLQGPYHLSYPCVFRDRDSWYMIPESVSSGAVDLYRCTRFPDRWELERSLLKGSAVDTTVWIEDGVYWFFVTFLEPRGNASQLWLYSAPSLVGRWTPHPANPISTDVRYARGGGAVFRHEGKLYRPSQDDSGEYGRRLILNEIVVMDQERYEEVPRVTVDPGWVKNLCGTHTYSVQGDVEIIDGKVRVPAGEVL